MGRSVHSVQSDAPSTLPRPGRRQPASLRPACTAVTHDLSHPQPTAGQVALAARRGCQPSLWPPLPGEASPASRGLRERLGVSWRLPPTARHRHHCESPLSSSCPLRRRFPVTRLSLDQNVPNKGVWGLTRVGGRGLGSACLGADLRGQPCSSPRPAGGPARSPAPHLEPPIHPTRQGLPRCSAQARHHASPSGHKQAHVGQPAVTLGVVLSCDSCVLGTGPLSIWALGLVEAVQS